MEKIAMAALVGVAAWRIRCLHRRVADEKRLRAEERRGRTRAEVALRNRNKRESGLRRIGVIRTPFVKRAGTPRQGLVCPSGRGKLVLDVHVSLDGLDQFSHVWLIFDFHANTNVATVTKVSPPRGYGDRVGWVATRSPHRLNPIGLSLAKLDQVAGGELRLSAVDLCDGTPVYDVKPFVPWDQPGSFRVPDWVSRDDSLRDVTWSDAAIKGLSDHAGPIIDDLYGADHAMARRAIDELLLQDPRNKRERNRRWNKESCLNASYRIWFGDVEVEFRVEDSLVTVDAVRPTPADDDPLRLGK